MFLYLPHPDWIPCILISKSDWADPWAVYIQWHSCLLSLECKFFGKGTLENLRIEHSGMCCTLSNRCFCSKLKTLLPLWQVEGNFWDKDKHSVSLLSVTDREVSPLSWHHRLQGLSNSPQDLLGEQLTTHICKLFRNRSRTKNHVGSLGTTKSQEPSFSIIKGCKLQFSEILIFI